MPRFSYLLHFSLSDGLGLKTSIGPALAGVPSVPLRGFACRLSEAVEKGHLLSQAEGGQVGLIWDRLLAIPLHSTAGNVSWLLMGVLLLFLDC